MSLIWPLKNGSQFGKYHFTQQHMDFEIKFFGVSPTLVRGGSNHVETKLLPLPVNGDSPTKSLLDLVQKRAGPFMAVPMIRSNDMSPFVAKLLSQNK